MAYITKSQLRALGNSATARFNEGRFRKSMAQDGVNVFLSHSHQDQDVVKEAVRLLASQGISVYVDWLDPTMPSTTSATTADRLKKHIREHERFLMLASDAALDSRWVPWELGYADAVRSLEEVAVFPMKSSGNDWTRSEYLGLYPWVEFRPTSFTGTDSVDLTGFVVCFPGKQTVVTLADWLKPKNSSYRF